MSLKLVDFQRIASFPSAEARRAAALMELEQADHVSVADAMIWRSHGGQDILFALEGEQQFGGSRKWRVQFERCPWSQELARPGGAVKWLAGRRTHMPDGRQITPAIASELKRRGMASQMVHVVEVQLDDDCCCELPFKEVSQLLFLFGFKAVGGEKVPVTHRAEQEQGVYYWCCREVSPDEAPKEKVKK